MVAVYIVKSFLFNIVLFFKHWYVDGWYWVYGRVLRALRVIEARIGMRVHIRFLFVPLYQEYNIFGYVIGFLFRIFRIGLGTVLYGCIAVFGALLYMVWAAIPLVLVLRILGVLSFEV